MSKPGFWKIWKTLSLKIDQANQKEDCNDHFKDQIKTRLQEREAISQELSLGENPDTVIEENILDILKREIKQLKKETDHYRPTQDMYICIYQPKGFATLLIGTPSLKRKLCTTIISYL